MDVSVIMINYNTFDLTKNALESIFMHTEGLLYEIILVDNASPDGSGDKLRDLFGNKIIYLQSGGNLGTSKAFNLGLTRISGKYVLWLNTDILIKENFIKKLFDYMESDPNCGICGGNIYDFKGKPAHSFRKIFPCLKEERKDKSVFLAVLRKIFCRPYYNQFNYTGLPMQVGYVTGADMMIRSELFQKVGGFDEDIFMYSEETEFTWRVVHDAGMTVVSVPNAYLLHLEGASFVGKKDGFSQFRFTNGLHGSCVMYTKCYGAAEAKKYLQLLLRSYRKFYFLSSVFFLKQKKEIYKQKIEIVKNYISTLHS